MFSKKIILGLTVLFISLNFSIYAIEGAVDNSALVQGTDKIDENQLTDGNAKGDKNDPIWIDVQFLNFMRSIGFTEDDICRLCQYNSVGSSGYKSDVDLEKSCGCRVKISESDNCIEVQLCDEHLKNLASFYASESEVVVENVVPDETDSNIENDVVPENSKDKITKESDYNGVFEDNITLNDIRLEDIYYIN